MKVKFFWMAFFLVAVFLAPAPALADGIIIPEPPICDPGPCMPRPVMGQLSIRYHRVEVKIQDQVAVTHVDQVFYNPNDWQIEGTYLFPIPQDAVVTSFTLWVDGQPVEGRVLDATEARQAYEEIVYSLRDPALLEYAGSGALQARIFPIPPQGERRIELEYSQVLTSENGLVRYIYPLNTEKFSAFPLEDVSVNVQVSSSNAPIRAVYSPSHPVAVSRSSDQMVSVGYEAKNVTPDTDFALLYSLGDEQAFHLMTYRDPSDPLEADGFFLLLLAPRPDAASQTLPKDVILVLDRSGSMDGEKFQQARQALQYILNNLNSDDRFNVIAFSTGMESYASGLRPASEAAEAAAWVDRLSAQGSTDINRALLEAAAIAGSERPAYLIFLTDGLPTVGEVDSQRILDNLAQSAPENLRLFVFGVGYDVDTFLLDSLAQEHHGKSTYVTPNVRLDETLSAFYASIRAPVMTSLELDFGGANAYDLYPNPLPDLFAGSQVVVAGRYRNPGVFNITLSGIVDGKQQNFRFSEQNFSEQSEDTALSAAIPRLWATRKIGYLLNQTRLQGPDQETIDQIVRLSIRYGIVTPYTSYLVTEDMPLGATEQSRIVGEQMSQLQAMPPDEVSGQAAVEKALDQGAMAGAEVPAVSEGEIASSVRQVGARTYVYSDGVWIDTAFDPESMVPIPVSFLSKDYFELAQSQPDLAAGFALGPRVIAFSQGKAYEVVDASDDVALVQSVSEPGNDLPAITQTPEGEGGADLDAQPVKKRALPCLGGLLPLMLVPLALFSRRRTN
jgi:Ca-activated chloride channel family protein